MTYKLNILLMAVVLTTCSYAYGKTKLNIKNETKDALTIKIIPSDMALDTAMGSLGHSQGLLNGRTYKIAPNGSTSILVSSKMTKLKNGRFEDIFSKEATVIGTAGLKKPGKCSGIALDGEEKSLTFKKHLLGVKCSHG